MAFSDLREWLSFLENKSQLHRINAPVHWDEELGAVTRKALDQKLPALLFENIKDHQDTDCRRVFVSSLSNYDRVAWMLGLTEGTSAREIIQTVRERSKNPIKPLRVEEGPVKENIKLGKDIDLLKLPIPKWNPLDAGRYLMTFGGVVTKDPDTGIHNVGLYRCQVIDENTLGILMHPDKHHGRHFAKYAERNEPMPVALVLGWDQVLPFCAAAPYSHQVSEYDMMGAFRQRPVELIRCETIDLEVPASAEIVIEGFISTDPSDFVMEGPFGEFTGYYAGEKGLKPSIKVSCITYRNNPIFQGTLEGKPIVEDNVVESVNLSAYAWNTLDAMGIPDVTDVYCPLATGFGTNIRVQIKKGFQGHAKQVAAGLFAVQAGCFKNVIVVEEDIDIHDPIQVEWAFAYRVDAKEDGIVIFPGFPGSGLDPSTPPDIKDPHVHGRARWNRLLIDATRDWRFVPREQWAGHRYPPVVWYSDEMDQLTAKRWNEYGFKQKNEKS